MKPTTFSTAGSEERILRYSPIFALRDWNEMLLVGHRVAAQAPGVLLRRKPLGTTTNNQRFMAMQASMITTISRECSSAQPRLAR